MINNNNNEMKEMVYLGYKVLIIGKLDLLIVNFIL